MQRFPSLYLLLVVIGIGVLFALGWFAYKGRGPAVPTKPEEALTIPPSGMPGPNPARMQEMQRRGQGQAPQGQ
jgi:hypothetical protein